MIFKWLVKFFLNIFFCHSAICISAQHALSAEGIVKLLPESIIDFQQKDESISKLIRLGDIQYSLAEKNYINRNQRVKILLFDFKGTSVMYKQAISRWNNASIVNTDTLVLRPVHLENCTGWETYNQQHEGSQIYLGVCNRFFLSIIGENIDLEALHKVLAQIKIRDFPK